MKKLVFASADDWQAVWVDGELVTQGHRIPLYDWLELLTEGPFQVMDQGEAAWFYDQCEEFGCVGELPEEFR